MYILLKSNPRRQHSKGQELKGQEKRKDRKVWYSRSEEKVLDFSSVSLFPARKRKTVTQGGTRGIDHSTRRKIQGAGIVKSWENKRYRGHISYTLI